MWCDAGDDLVGWVAQRGVFVVGTLVYFESISGRTTTVDHAAHGSFEHALHARHVCCTRPACRSSRAPTRTRGRHEHGVAVHRELELLARAGLTPRQALTAPTSAPPSTSD
ncbi:hypothetical protein [Saccharothrix luteola]|uniref:hypothetical protein n=1 Tax=Saccharothrix luteola TaxID=2893018 RepID=UPI001E3648AF|nr:hypothetical protein [Saccharothrix luteola]MCC8247691.1 hypothetical protein [Saccharothrix luteola]